MFVFNPRHAIPLALFRVCLVSAMALVLAAGQASAGSGRRHYLPRLHNLAPSTDRIIVRYRTAPVQPQKAATLHRLGLTALMPLAYHRRLGSGAHVYKMPRKLRATDARLVAQRIARDPNVLSAEPVYRMYLNGAPNDPLYPQQWGLGAQGGGINIEAAWTLTQGTPGVVVAVLDSGIRPEHVEFKGRLVAGYDFVSDPQMAADGDGRDADATDPGDYCSDPLEFSDWHGTHVAGIIGAATNNGVGIAGINPRAMILPVRVVGRCGGMTDDTLDAMRWAAGLSVPNIPDNPHPARILNLSLGAPDVPSCSPEFQKAIDDVRAKGAIVVVSAGNDRKDASTQMPANCRGVITVAAVDPQGNKADVKTADLDWGTNYGPAVTISAPGVGILSTINSGDMDPGHDDYAAYDGTSMAAPHVAGILSLMLSVNPGLTPDQATQLLQQSRRPFAPGANCSGICAAGMADAALAVQQARTFTTQQAPVVGAGSNQAVQVNSQVTLQGNARSGRPIVSWQWRQLSGPTVTLSSPAAVTTSFRAPASPGVLTFRLTVQDQAGLSASAEVTVTVNGPPAPAAVSAGSNRTVDAGSPVTLAGHASAPASVTLKSYQWHQLQGPVVVLNGALTPTLSFVAPKQAATLVFQLQATDSLGRVATAQVTITVKAPAASPPSVLPPPAGQSPAPPPPVTAPPPAPPPPVTAPPVANPPAGAPPQAAAGPAVDAGSAQVVRPGSLVILNGSATATAPARIRSYHWIQTSGRHVRLLRTTNSRLSFIAPRQPGGLAFRLVVTDSRGRQASADVHVRVLAPLVLMFFGAPRVHIEASPTARQGSAVQLRAIAQPSLMGEIVSYQWQQTSGPVAQFKNTGNILRLVAPRLTDRRWHYLTFAVTVADSFGRNATGLVTIRVVP